MKQSQRFRRVWLAVAVAVVAAACGNSAPYVPDMTEYQVVLRWAESAFEVGLDLDEDRDALTRFVADTAGAQTRDDLTAAWRAIPALEAKGADFLAKHVLSKVESDGDWPAAPRLTERQSFVDGVRAAAQNLLAEDGS